MTSCPQNKIDELVLKQGAVHHSHRSSYLKLLLPLTLLPHNMHNPRRSEYPSISSGKDYRDCDIPPDFSLEELQLEPESGDRYRTVSIEFQIQIVDVLFIFSSGSRSAGKVTVTSSPDQLPGAADIRITAKHMFEGVLDQARVLLMCMGERSKGVGIFVSILVISVSQ